MVERRWSIYIIRMRTVRHGHEGEEGPVIFVFWVGITTVKAELDFGTSVPYMSVYRRHFSFHYYAFMSEMREMVF